MKLKNQVNIKNATSSITIVCTSFAVLILGIAAFLYFSANGSYSFADNTPTENNKTVATGKDFRILQNGVPVNPIMGVAVNLDGIFDIQIRSGVDLKKVKNLPLSAEFSILRGSTKVQTKTFKDITELKTNNLKEWLISNYQAGDKISVGLLNTILAPDQSTKIYSLGSIY